MSASPAFPDAKRLSVDAYLAQIEVLRRALVERLKGVLTVPESAPIWASRRIDDRIVS